MLNFAIKYHRAINAMTANKSLKLCKFELDDEEWGIADDLVAALQVKYYIYYYFRLHANTLP